MQKKQFSFKATDLDLSDSGRGTGRVVFATLNQIDKDGDITAPGAFGKQTVHVLPMHVWADADPPFIGVATISETDQEAIAEIEINLDTQRGREWRSALKFALDRGKTIEWSYGFDVLDSESAIRDGKKVRILKSLKVHEVSPVIIGAGNNTRTLAMKGAASEKVFAALQGTWEETQMAIAEAARELMLGGSGGGENADGWLYIEGTYPDSVVLCVQRNGEQEYYQFDWSVRDDGSIALGNPREIELDVIVREKAARFDTDFARVIGDVVSVSKRQKALAALRQKEGRVLSQASRSRIAKMLETMRPLIEDMQQLLDDTDPEAAAKHCAEQEQFAALEVAIATTMARNSLRR